MHWKALLATIVIIGIAGLVILRFGTNKILGSLPDFSAFIPFLNPSPSSGNPFPIKLEADRSSFYAQSYDVTDVIISGSGSCLRIGSMTPTMLTEFQNKNGNCSFKTEKTNGKIEMRHNLIRFDLDSISLDLAPTNLTISNVNIPKLSLSSINGKISKLKGNEWVSEPLDGSSIEIDNFIGEVIIDESSVTLNGYTTRVIGTDFTWTG